MTMSKDKKNYWKILNEMSRKAESIRKDRIKEAKSEKQAKFWATRRINWILLHEIYDVGEASEFKTVEDWNYLGYTVKLDSRPYVIWGQKTEKDKYFPLVYLFSDLQVLKPQDVRELEELPSEEKELEILTTVNIDDDLI